MMPNYCSIYAQFLPNKNARPQNGTGFDTGNVLFYRYLFSPMKRQAPADTLQKTGGGFCFVMLYTQRVYILVALPIALYTQWVYNIDS
nr:MAG TPA: hypothetical protein [Caudoviricetes sp.]